jgi:hypothetical protein
LGQQKVGLQLALAVLLPLILIFFHPAETQGLYPAEAAVTPMSALLGLGVGLIMEQAWVQFRVEAVWWRRALRYLLGLLMMAIFYLGPGLLIPEQLGHGMETIARLVRYALLGWAVSFLGPWLFVRLHLADRAEL